jgi:hypothetical protein
MRKNLKRHTHKIKNSSGKTKSPVLAGLFYLYLLISGSTKTLALPEGYETVTGSVRFEKNANVLNVSSESNKSIVNYQGFNLTPNEIVNFNLPNSSAVILNRVIGGTPSEIFGSINSNGQVFLINPSGILFGASAQVNVGSLLASTLDIKNEDFLKNNYSFSQTTRSNSVANLGNISTHQDGSVVLLGGSVQNLGNIDAPEGNILIAVGNTIKVPVEKGIMIDVKIDQALKEKTENYQNAILNSGTLKANGGLIKLNTELTNKLYELSVNNEGQIVADGLRSSGGTVELISQSQDGSSVTRNTGTISANGNDGIGGKVNLLGDKVILENEAIVSASGKSGGGQILIGGDYQGRHSELVSEPKFNSQTTFVGSKVNIYADAKETGDGGKVIVWADDSTRFYGSLSAKGGSKTGNGGFAEISGKNSLIAKGEVDLSAPNGEFGTLLYDPLNIQIVGGSADGDDQGNAVTTQLQNNPGSNTLGTINFADEGAGTPNPFIIYESEIEGTNANIILQARNGITTSGTFGGSEVLIQNNRNLTMQTQNLLADGTSGIDLTGSTHGNSLLFRTQGTGTITLQTNTGGASTAPIIAGRLQTANQSIILQSNGGNINLNGTTNAGTGGLTLNSNGGVITQGSGAITAGNLTVSSAAGNATLTNSANNITTLLASSTGGNISYREADGQSFALGASTLSGGGDLTLQVGGAGAITQTGAVAADILNITTGSGNATLGTAGNNINNLVANSTSGTISYAEGVNNTFDLSTSNLGTGNLTLTTSGTGSIIQSGASSGNILTLNTATGNATFNTVNNDFNTFAGTSTSTGTIAYRDDNGFAVGANNRGTANLTLQSATGNITQTAAVTANILNVTSTSGNATLTNTANNISTLTANTSGGNVSYTEALNNSFILGASSLGSGNLDLNISGLNATITQTGVASGNTLTVNSASTGNATLNTFNNDFNTLAGTSTSSGNLAYRDDNGFDIATNNRGTSNLILQTATGNITQSGAITAGSLTVSSTSGNTTLTNSANNITTLLVNSTGGNVSYREADGQSFALGTSTLSGGGDLTLQVGGAGAITQSGAVVADVLNITTASGNATLGTAGNNINNLVANSTSGTIAYVEGLNNSFDLSASNLGTGNLTLTTSGTGSITQSAISTGNILTLNTATGNVTFNTVNNDFNTFAGTSTSTGTIAYRDDNGFAVGANNRGTANLTLQSATGNITQSGAVTANILNVQTSSGNATLTNTANNISTLQANSTGGNIFYREADGQSFALGTSTLSGGGDLSLQVGGSSALTQTGAVVADVLNITAGTAGTTTLTNIGNNINTLNVVSGNASVTYREADNNAFDISGANLGTGTLTLQTGGTSNITQSGSIAAATLNTTFGSGNVTLNNASNSLGTLINSSTGGNLQYTESTNNNLILGVNNLGTGDLSINLSGTGVLTQTGAITADELSINLGTSGNSVLSTGGNNINTLNATSTGANLTYTEGTNNSFNLNTANFTGGGDLSVAVGGTGTLAALSPIVADVLFVTTGTNAATISNANINTFRANSAGGLVTFNAAPNQSFNLGTSAMTGFGDLTLNLSGSGVVTQTGALTGVEILTVKAGTSGNNILTNSGNDISTLFVSGNGGNVSYLEQTNGFFNLGSSNLATGNLNLTVSGSGTIAQSGSLIADTLSVSSGSGGITFTNVSNNINSLTATSTSGSISFTDANGFSVNASNVGSGGLTLTGGNTVGADINVLGLVSGNNRNIGSKNDGNINLGANINATGTTTLSTQTTGNIVTGSNTINSNILNITTVSGHASQDGTSGGAAINTNVNNFAGNTTSGTIRINDIDNLNMDASAIAAGRLFASNSAGNITIDDNVTATTGQLNFNAFNDLIIDKLSTNLSVTTGATGSMNLTAGRDILIGSNATSGNLNVDGGLQTVNAGRDLIITGRGVAGSGAYSRLQGIGNGTAQNITTGRDLIIQMSTNTTGDNNFGTIATTSTTGNQVINVGGELKVLGGTDNNSVSTSSARLSSTAAQNITVNGNITVQGGSGNNNTAIISAASTQNISSTTGSINVLGGSGTNSPGRILTTANSAALPSTISATTGGINIGTNGGILATANAGTITLNGGTAGIAINGNAQGGVGNQVGSLTLNVTGGANITQTGGAVNGGRINISTDSGNATLTNADFTSMAATSNGGSVNYSDTDGFTLTNIDLGGGDLTSTAFAPLLTASNAFAETNMSLTGNITNINNVTLTANGAANITQSAGSLIANNLTINVNSGDASLNLANNNIANLTSSIGVAGGSIQYTDSNDVNVLAVSGFANLTSGNTFGVTANGSITGINLLGPITTGGGNLSFLADNDNNGSGSISIGGDLNSNGGNISLKGAGLLLPFNLASGSGTINLTSTAANNINQGLGTSITGATLNTTIGSGTANLTNTTNDVTNFSASSTLGGTVNFVDANSFSLNASNMGTGNLSLTAAGGGIGAGDINQSSNLIANRLDLQVGSGNATLFNVGNNINILGGSTANGNITMRDENGGFATDNISVGTGTLYLRSGAAPGITQLTGTSLTGNNLVIELIGSSNAILTNSGNDFNTINLASQATFTDYFDANGFSILRADMDSNDTGAIGSLSLSSSTGNIDQVGAIDNIEATNFTITTTSGNTILNFPSNDVSQLSANTNSGAISFVDSDGLTLGNSNLGNGSLNVTSEVSGAAINNNRTIESGITLNGNISGFGNITLATNGSTESILQSGGSISGNGLTLTTVGGNIAFNDADFISLTGSTNTGNLTYKDKDGIVLNNLNTGTGDLTISTLTPAVLSDNGVTENNTTVNGPLNANNITLDISSGDLLLGNSSIQAGNLIDIQVSGGNILGNTNINFPTLVAPLIQIDVSGYVGTLNAPIGLGITGLLPGSYINEAGRFGFVGQSILTSLDQDISNSFYLFPSSFLFPQIPLGSGNTTTPFISTTPFLYSVLTYEDNQDNSFVVCSESASLGWVCKKRDAQEENQNLALKDIYRFGNKLSY